MSHLEIKRTSQEDGSENIELQIGGITKVTFSRTAEMTIDQVFHQFERALQGLPKGITMTTEAVRSLLNLLVPELAPKSYYVPPLLSEASDLFKELKKTLEQNFRKIFSQKTYGVKVRWFLENNEWYRDREFDFGKAFSEGGKLAVLYSKNRTIDEAKNILRTPNAGTKTLDAVIDVLIKSGFPISE